MVLYEQRGFYTSSRSYVAEYSPLDGMCKLEELILKTKELGQPAVAITDHSTLYALWKAQKLQEKHGVKVIKGCEFYFTQGYDENGKPQYGHIALLAKNYQGIVNLFKLQERAYTEDRFYYRQQITIYDLMEFHEGLICTSACLANIIPQSIMNGDVKTAKTWINTFKQLFGEDFYLEIQPNSIPEQRIVNKMLVYLAKEFNVELIATNDVHYILKDDHKVHEVLLALSTQKKMTDEKRFKFTTTDFWFKTREEMKAGFDYISDEDVERALNNTVVVSNKCNAEIPTGHYLPKYPFSNDPIQTFKDNVWSGYEKKKDEKIDDNDYRNSLQQEIEVITEEGYADYFLIVEDYIKRAREAKILVGDGRGSGAGSKSCYAMDITRVEPREYGLIFERFLAKGREPDIDSDFSDIDAVFELLGEAYGWENVGRIASFGTFAPRAITRRILQCFGHSERDIKLISSLLPTDPFLTWEQCLQNKPYIDAIKRYPDEWTAIQRLQGSVSHTSMHAGGIIIWNKLSDVLPVKVINNMQGKRIKRVVCFDMDDLHELGHFKFDILGLSTLETLDLALKNVKTVHGIDIDLTKIDYEDKNILAMLASGDVKGVFQLEEQAQRVKQQSPGNFRDVIAINALIRPGTGTSYFRRRSGEIEWSVIPEREWYMSETYGDYVYQEQYMLDAHVLASWDLAYADKKLRKNKDIRNDVETRNKFFEDCRKVGILKTEAEIAEIWADIENAVDGGYGFNKSHATTYGRIAFQEGYLKYYYPECFYSAILTKKGDDQDKVGEFIAECKRRGIKVLPPNINESEGDFIPTPEGIMYRLTSITNVGDSAIRGIKDIRPIKSLQDLLERRNKSLIKKNVIESLIKAGVFDFEHSDRQYIMHQLDQYLRTKTQIKQEHECPLREFDKLAWEKEALGVYLSSHPLDKYAFKSLQEHQDNSKCLVAGIVSDVRVFYDKNGNEMAFITISNQQGNMKCIAFSRTWADKSLGLSEKLECGNIIMVRGKRSGNDCIIDSVEIIEKLS